MPVFAPAAVSAYDVANTVLNMTRARINQQIKTLQPTNGKLLDLTNAHTQQVFNTSWRKSQDYLAEKGYSRLTDEVIISSLPVVGSNDPAAQAWLSWAGYFDGQNQFPQPQLPQGFSHPLKIWERWSNQNAEFPLNPMEKCLDGIPAFVKTTSIRYWEWRNDAIYMPGSQVVEDLRIRHVIYLPDITQNLAVTGDWWVQPVPVVRIADGLSWMLCAELALGNGDMATHDSLMLRAEAGLLKVFNLDVKADQRVNVQRRPRGGSRGFGRYF